jgi:hypothetical protein
MIQHRAVYITGPSQGQSELAMKRISASMNYSG